MRSETFDLPTVNGRRHHLLFFFPHLSLKKTFVKSICLVFTWCLAGVKRTFQKQYHRRPRSMWKRQRRTFFFFFPEDVRCVLLREPCLKSLEGGLWASKTDQKKRKRRARFRNLTESSFFKAAPQSSHLSCSWKRRKYCPHAVDAPQKTSRYYILPFVALDQCKVQSLANCTKKDYLATDEKEMYHLAYPSLTGPKKNSTNWHSYEKFEQCLVCPLLSSDGAGKIHL